MNLKLTKKAEEEQQKLIAGEIASINFSKMAVGSGSYTSEELVNNITELRSVEIITEIADVYQETVKKVDQDIVKNESQLFISSTFFNEDVEETFEVREVGIYAISHGDEKEYLYAYYLVASTDLAISIIQDKSLPQYIPISVNTKLSNIDEVNITIINDMLVVNQDEFKRYKVSIKEYIDAEDTSVRTYVNTEDTKIKTLIVEQDTAIRTYINEEDAKVRTSIIEQDAAIKTYIDTEDAKIETLVNTKANFTHVHGLGDSYISGVLPTYKGGTGNTTGGASAYVGSYIKNNAPYLIATSYEYGNYPSLYRVDEGSYVKHINMHSFKEFSNHMDHIAPYNGWIRAHIEGNSYAVIKIGNYASYLNSMDSAITFNVMPGGFMYAPIRKGQYFRTEYCSLGVRLYKELS